MQYNENVIKLTEIPKIIDDKFSLEIDFLDKEKNDEDSSYYFINGRVYKVLYHKNNDTDTINTTLWFNGKLPTDSQDSALFHIKVMYSYLLYKSNEKRLNEDDIVKVRYLFPIDNNVEGDWFLSKVLFLNDSSTYTKKVIDSNGKTYEKTYKIKKIKQKNLEKLLNELSEIRKYTGWECVYTGSYPSLLEYYDGKSEHTFLISKKCKIDKDLEKLYKNIITKLWTELKF
jgi:hypothetical protein